MTRIYLITPPKIEPKQFKEPFAAALDAGDVGSVQLRLKNASEDDWQRAIDALMPIAWQRDIAFIVNDRVDLAKKVDADGVHLGEDDESYEAARAALGEEKIIGMSCYDSKDKAIAMAEKGADYVAFGAAYPTLTKEAKASAPLNLYADWVAATTVPVVAIGGITPFNCAPLVRAGVDFLAVISCIWDHPESAAAGVKALQTAIEKA